MLVIAYFFPPLGGAGVQRTLKFIKYLPDHGWRPTVVTTTSSAYPAADRSLLDEMPPTLRVLRAHVPDLLVRALGLLRMACGALRLRWLQRLLAWPDPMVPWAAAALPRALREIRRQRPDVLYSTSPPQSAHLVAMVAHRLTGVPWVADFRDEWSENPHQPKEPPLFARVNRRVERAMTHYAAQVVTAADYFDIAGASPKQLVTIPNGVDPADFEGLPDAPQSPTDRFRVSFVGTLYGDRDCRPVLQSLRRLVESGQLDPRRVELRIVGNVWLKGRDWLPPVPVEITGYVDHRRALEEMTEASALLLYVAQASLAPGGKLWEYLASGRPILCVTRPDNLASRLVRTWGAGICAAPDDGAGIEDAILGLYSRWKLGELPPTTDARALALEHFSRPVLAGQLASVLDRAAGAGQIP